MLNKMTAAGVDADTIARVEIIREWTTNPEFRKFLSDRVYAMTGGPVPLAPAPKATESLYAPDGRWCPYASRD